MSSYGEKLCQTSHKKNRKNMSPEGFFCLGTLCLKNSGKFRKENKDI